MRSARSALASLTLEDGVELLLLGDLHLGVGPAGNLNDHVEDGLVGIGVEGDVAVG